MCGRQGLGEWEKKRLLALVENFEFDYGGSASLNMHIMDHLMRRSILIFLDLFQIELIKYGTNVVGFMITVIFLNSYPFSNVAHWKSPSSLSRVCIFSRIIFKRGKDV